MSDGDRRNSTYPTGDGGTGGGAREPRSATYPNPFKIGDVVKYRCGSPLMVVRQVNIELVWLEWVNSAGEARSVVMPWRCVQSAP